MIGDLLPEREQVPLDLPFKTQKHSQHVKLLRRG
jgi:hypothetical protein